MIDKRAFENLCKICEIPVPKIKIVDGDADNVTGPDFVQFNKNDDVHHVFGHYLIDLHEEEPDLVADAISRLILDAQSYRLLLGALEANGNAF